MGESLPPHDDEALVQQAEIDVAVGRALLGGLLLSVTVMVLGLGIAGSRGEHNLSTVLPLDRVIPHLLRGDASAVLDTGILLLFATPLAGVLVTFAAFVHERDTQFGGIVGALIVLLAIGFVVALR